MLRGGLRESMRKTGLIASWAVFCLGIAYGVALLMGLLSLKSPQDAIGDPYFSLLELLIILIMPPVVIGLIALRERANAQTKMFGTIAVSFASIATAITCSVHFVILFASKPIAAAGLQHSELLFSFKWPSVAYAMDILAWDVFFSLSLLFAVPLLGRKGLEKVIRVLLIIAGVLSLAGLVGVPIGNMQVRMIGVVGYAGLSPFAFLLIAVLLGQSRIGETSRNKN
jgi:hypothetical protein